MDTFIDSFYTYMNETLKKKIPILVDTYVSQYGEEYRDKILNKISNIEIIPYFKLIQKDISTDLKPARRTLEYITTIAFLIKMGILEPDTIEGEKIIFDNEEVKCLLESFFGQQYINSDPEYIQNYSGVYSFLYNRQSPNNYEHFQILKKKMEVLKKLGIIDIEEKDYFEFEKSEFYRHLEKYYEQIAQIILSYSKEINYKYMLLNNIYVDKINELLKLKKQIIENELTNFFNTKCLTPKNLDMNILFSPETLNYIYSGLLEVVIKGYDKMVEQNVPRDELFIEKMLENIRSEYRKITEDMSIDELEQIINRFQYLFPTIKELKGEKIAGETPKENDDSIKKRRRKIVIEFIEHIEKKYIYEAVKLVLISNKKSYKELRFSVSQLFSRESVAFAKVPHYLHADIPNLVFISISTILDYEIIDCVIDHEVRHIIESYSSQFCLKYGTQYYKCNDDVWEWKNVNFDEAYTEKLSIEACEKRLCEGKYIFSPLKQIASGYYIWLQNLNIILEENEEILMMAKMYDGEILYELLPYTDWDEIDRLIPQPHEEVKEELKVYALKLKQKTRELIS